MTWRAEHRVQLQQVIGTPVHHLSSCLLSAALLPGCTWIEAGMLFQLSFCPQLLSQSLMLEHLLSE